MRMKKRVVEGHDARHDGRSALRLGISAIGEPAAGRDEQLGNIFHNMRVSLNLSREGMARRLGVNASIVDTFEAGVVTALPPWQETRRIVGGYCELARIDPEPILWRISSQLQAAADHIRAATARPSAPAKPAALRHARRPEQDTPRAGRRGRRARNLFVLTAPIAFLAGAIYVVQAVPGEVYRAIRLLPAPIAAPVRTGFDYFLLLTAPRREGLRWLETGDPRLRKADKLQPGKR
jgi:transcriptional regulator with XRE-family HTH domain